MNAVYGDRGLDFLRVFPVAFLLAGLALGAALSWKLGRAPLLVELAQARSTQAEAAKLAALAAARGLQLAQARGDALSTALAAKQAQLYQLQKDRHAALQRFTTGRACLGAAAVGVLNGADSVAGAGLEPVPPPTGGAAAAGASFATDADVGHWAIAARAAHGECRARLDALIDWHGDQGTP